MDKLQIEVTGKTYSFYRSVYAPVESNMYILIEEKEAIVVDSNISEYVCQFLKDKDVQTVHLFLTHEHYDHSHGVIWFQKHFNTILYCHEACEGLLSTKKNSSPRLVAFVLSAKDMNDHGYRYEDFKKGMTDYELKPDVFLKDNEIIDVHGHKIKVIHTPGHSQGSCLLVLDDQLVFSGDTLIKDNKIITCFRGGNKESMSEIALPKIKQLPDELMVMPGHGNPFKKEEFDFSI